MKFLIFVFVIAVVQQEYETILDKPIEECTPIERVKLFQKYVLELVHATIPPFLRNGSLIEGGSECISGVRRQVDLNAIDAILAIMSITHNYLYEMAVLRVHTDVTKMEINDELMEHIRKILVVIERSSLHFNSSRINEYFEPYLLKYKRGLSTAEPGTSAYDENLELGRKCHRTMLSFPALRNEKFFEQLTAGSYLVRVLMKSDDNNPENESRKIELNNIIESLSTYRLKTANFNISNETFVQILQSIGEYFF